MMRIPTLSVVLICLAFFVCAVIFALVPGTLTFVSLLITFASAYVAIILS